MSRGKKAKKKIGGRRKQESSMVAATIRLTDVDGAGIIPINESLTQDLSSTTAGMPVKYLRSKSLEIAERSTSNLTIPESNECNDKSGLCFAETRINGSKFAILFKSEDLQKLRNVLRKTDLSRTPLLLGAIILGKVDIVKRLLRDGYPINSRSEEDKTTALMWAVRRKDLEMINLLVRHGADLTLLDENNDNVALIAVQSSSWEQNDFLDFWNSIDRKIDLKHVNTRGFTILHYARERHWDILAELIDEDPRDFVRKNSIVKNSCFCCYCSSTSAPTRYRVKEVFPSDDMESTLSYLGVLFDEIVNRYRDTWSRDRELGYPDFQGGHGDSAATIEDLLSLRREEIARLNTVLPKLEESYLQKLCDCWSSLVTKMRQSSSIDARKFDEFVTSIQIQLLTHQVCPGNEENVEFYPPEMKITSRNSSEFLEILDTVSDEATSGIARVLEESSREFDLRPKVGLNS